MGASGGRGSGEMGSTLGATVRAVVELVKGEQLYFMIGQPGTDACPKVIFPLFFIYYYLYLRDETIKIIFE